MRKDEHRQFARSSQQALKGSKYCRLRNFPGLRAQPCFSQLYRLNLRTSKASQLKETFGGFWQHR